MKKIVFIISLAKIQSKIKMKKIVFIYSKSQLKILFLQLKQDITRIRGKLSGYSEWISVLHFSQWLENLNKFIIKQIKYRY
ncbi:hypothetical protein BpHYR1_017569 [Brachionus plicatilis]|uniref:Uncharacterized protein n=1 Tax=Brachionus plicatilis TaxID=10195 RepID=A0A3M7Q582_BRAPC|nr:hypothetical protein BpHYR1_017569 [Brachionus plicatilis]